MEILYTYNTTNFSTSIMLAISVCGLITTLGLVIYLAFFDLEPNNNLSKIIISSICGLSIILSSFMIIKHGWNSPSIGHKVIVEDMNQIDTDKYKIVDQEGDIINIEVLK